jgi:hypothetical protein
MEKRRLKMKLAGLYHLGELSVGLTPEEQKSLDSLIADGMDKAQAKNFVLGMRKDQSNMTMALGAVVTVIGRTSWPSDKEDPNPVLIVQSATGVIGIIRANNTELVTS